MDLPMLCAALDEMVLTFRNEGTPIALIEARSSRQAGVCHPRRGVADVVLDGKTAVLVPPEHPRAVPRGVPVGPRQPEPRKALGEAARL
jgi:hypothetical protein